MPDNAARMEEARESACNDMGKMLQLVLPVATQIQQEVIKSYGFNNEGEGEHNAPVSNIIFTLENALKLDLNTCTHVAHKGHLLVFQSCIDHVL